MKFMFSQIRLILKLDPAGQERFLYVIGNGEARHLIISLLKIFLGYIRISKVHDTTRKIF